VLIAVNELLLLSFQEHQLQQYSGTARRSLPAANQGKFSSRPWHCTASSSWKRL